MLVSKDAGAGCAGFGFAGLILWPVFAMQRGDDVPWGLRPATCWYTTITLSFLTVWFAAEQASRAAQMGLAERTAGLAQTIWPLAVVLSCRLSRPGELPRTEPSNTTYS